MTHSTRIRLDPSAYGDLFSLRGELSKRLGEPMSTNETIREVSLLLKAIPSPVMDQIIAVRKRERSPRASILIPGRQGRKG